MTESQDAYRLSGESIITNLKMLREMYCHSQCGYHYGNDCPLEDDGVSCPTIRAISFAITIVGYFLSKPNKGYCDFDMWDNCFTRKYAEEGVRRDFKVDEVDYGWFVKMVLDKVGIIDNKGWTFPHHNRDTDCYVEAMEGTKDDVGDEVATKESEGFVPGLSPRDDYGPGGKRCRVFLCWHCGNQLSDEPYNEKGTPLALKSPALIVQYCPHCGTKVNWDFGTWDEYWDICYRQPPSMSQE